MSQTYLQHSLADPINYNKLALLIMINTIIQPTCLPLLIGQIYKAVAMLLITVVISACETSEDLTNNTPIATAQNLKTSDIDNLQIILLATDSDGDPLTYTIASLPTHGTVSGKAPHLMYHPKQGYSGIDSFSFKANDGKDDSNTVDIYISIHASNNAAPQASAKKFTVFSPATLDISSGASDADNDQLTFTITEQPKYGKINGTPPILYYEPNSGFEGEDSFSYIVNDGHINSQPASVLIDVFSGECPSSSFLGPSDNLFLHIPNKLGLLDLSSYHHRVSSNFKQEDRWISRVDMSNKAIYVDLKNSTLNSSSYSVSFKFQPHSLEQISTLFSSSAIEIEQHNNQIISKLLTNNGSPITLIHKNKTIKTRTCNQIVLVVSNSSLSVYLNGIQHHQSIDLSQLKALSGLLKINKHKGKLWDIRIYETDLAMQDIATLNENCSENSGAAQRVADYPNYLCATYVCEYWGNDMGLEFQQFEYYAKAQDEVHERHIFDAGMYPRGEICAYPDVVHNQDLTLSDGIIKNFTKPFGYHRPLERKNAQHWLHENFHSYQGTLKRYFGFSGHKFLLEGTASWGADTVIPAPYDTLLGFYTLHPHLPLWTIQNSPVDDYFGWEFKGGHQYGSSIFWSYLSRHVLNKRIIGDIFNDRRAGSEPTRVAFELLAKAGVNMKDVFSHFASRITTWDLDYGEDYRRSENGSLQRMQNAFPQAEAHNKKFSDIFSHNGTGNRWTDVGAKTTPGGWAFNAYQVTVNSDANYRVAVRAGTGNPINADFRARIIVHTLSTNERRYYDLTMLPSGKESSMSVAVNTGDILYLVVSATPDEFSGWDTYKYQYKIYPQN